MTRLALAEATVADGEERRGSASVLSGQRLADTFVELADTLAEGFNVGSLLEVLTARCVELLDVTSAGILLADNRGGTLTAVAASDERAWLLCLFEVQADEGPCRDCCRAGAAVLSVDFGSARERWPRFALEAAAIGFRAADALPLRRVMWVDLVAYP